MIIKHIPTGRQHVVTDKAIVEEIMIINGWRRENCLFLDCGTDMKPAGKIYCGWRPRVGGEKVTVNGKPLEHIVFHSPTGVSWGFGGSGPADLSLSILTDHFNGDKGKAMKYHQDFKWDFVAYFRDSWSLTDLEIEAWLKEKGAK